MCLRFENFKFSLQEDFLDDPHFTYYVPLEDAEDLFTLKEGRFDILSAFGMESKIKYYAPNKIWRILIDFKKVRASMKTHEQNFLEKEQSQRRFLRVKIEHNWYIMVMVQPTFYIFKKVQQT